MNLKLQKKIALAVLTIAFFAFSSKISTPIYFDTPKGWPKPNFDFKNNPLTEEGFQLGRKLFYDPILSRDNTISCSSCHLQQTGFTHVDHDLSHGIDGKIGTRNSPVLINLAWNKSFHWDGKFKSLEEQVINPIRNPIEMDQNIDVLVEKLQKNSSYKILFKNAFGDTIINSKRLFKALAQFTVMLISSNSKYDKVMRNETEFTSRELKGYDLFKNNCASCHKEPLFTNNKFEFNGLALDKELNDYGRMNISQNEKDRQKFKVPTLRNVQFTFPYMHDGRFKTLTEVIKHYNTIENNEKLPKELRNKINLSDNDRVDLVLFLSTLTDREFLNNARFSFPKNN